MSFILLTVTCLPTWADSVRMEKVWSLSKDQKGRHLFLMPLEAVEDDHGNLLILDKGGQVQIYNGQGNLISILDLRVKERCCGEPSDIALDGKGNIFLCYPNIRLVQGFDYKGNRVYRFPSVRGTPMQIAIDSHGNVYLNEVGFKAKYILCKYDLDGNLLGEFGEPAEPVAVARRTSEDFRRIIAAEGFIGIDSQDNIYFAFRASYILRKYSPSGNLIWEVKPELSLSQPKEGAYFPVGDMEVTPEGQVFVLRVKGPSMDIWNPKGKLIETFRPPEHYFGFCLGRQALYFIENIGYGKIDKFILK